PLRGRAPTDSAHRRRQRLQRIACDRGWLLAGKNTGAIRRSGWYKRRLSGAAIRGSAAVMKSLSEKAPKSFSRLTIAAVTLSIWMCTPASVLGQSSGCVLVPDDRNPSEKILRCGSNLTIRSAPGTRYGLTGPDNQREPSGARLDSGALLIEFTPSE